ncbi:MAG: aminotransferase class IV, partial [Caulobacteraceae bacterium]
ECGVLNGIVRGATIEAAGAAGIEVREVHDLRDRLERAGGLFLTNSLIGLRPVAALDGIDVKAHPSLDALIDLVSSRLGV